MELRIGIQHSPRELSIETKEASSEVEKRVQDALASGATTLRFVDDKERVYLVQTASLLYVEISPEEPRRIGFIG
ncbi:DUF3107 domain-containing protein [Pseudoclavibacter chungangensis]|uniref:DUF3107 domain-containing protein n=1 Tax=Pseudoclavibacter chungangensis TaxID=587635 RepID=A0A7J5BRP1_9MICO|nr:DUF3107 domain-containing protein [Pseudoclavibacter chungangensis]KAB1655107.1 DUF3107 domain-containing protein [Pseudoclavibacter chungangensis]NYJ66121.1 hypothetical protein [Pseudoclavibacter chungangensis]